MMTPKWITRKITLANTVLLLFAGLTAPAFQAGEGAAATAAKPAAKDKQSQAQTTGTTQPSTRINERVQVLGSSENAAKLPGSAHFITSKELEEQSYSDIQRVLRKVPGINIQEEDGLGLRPNIGMRGTGVERSSKITIMEDGVLIAPAPYTAPSAYYFPSAGRMESVEILKGSSSIRQGPFTNGGALNLISTSIPGKFGGNASLSGGSHGIRKLGAAVGDSRDRFGYVVETFQLQSDGFKDLDNGGDTGVELSDYVGKLRFNSHPNAEIYQSFELKFSKTEQDGDETYLGLTQEDFERTPYRRYAASQNDNIDTDHEQFQARYHVQFSPTLDVTVTAYRNNFFRDWFKNEKTNGISNRTILNNPDDYAGEVAILRGDINSDPDAVVLRHNRRDYYSQGLQTTAFWTVSQGTREHRLEAGIRIHQDEEDRFQEEDKFQMTDGNLVLTSLGAPGSQSNRVSDAEALSFFITDTFSSGNWTFRPGLRHESIDYTREDYSRADPDRSEGPTRIRKNDVDIWLPGLGIDYALGHNSRVFFGVHKGFSPPGAGKNEATESEESWNYEAGYKHKTALFQAEAIAFFNDYSNLLGAETVSGGGSSIGELFNGGDVDVAGFEGILRFDLLRNHSSGVQMPLSVVYTYTTTEFKTNFTTSFADWSPEVVAGDELPYIPENQLNVNLGFSKEQFSAYLALDYTGDMRTKAGSGAIPLNEEIENRLVTDLSTRYQFSGRYAVTAQIRNLFDEEYLVSRRPYGARPGLKRTFLLGISANF